MNFFYTPISLCVPDICLCSAPISLCVPGVRLCVAPIWVNQFGVCLCQAPMYVSLPGVSFVKHGYKHLEKQEPNDHSADWMIDSYQMVDDLVKEKGVNLARPTSRIYQSTHQQRPEMTTMSVRVFFAYVNQWGKVWITIPRLRFVCLFVFCYVRVSLRASIHSPRTRISQEA